MSRDPRLRVAVWSTGGVGSRAIAAVNRRPDLELVGVWVHTPEKVGRDVGDIIGCELLGIFATNDAQEIIDLAADGVVYAASGPERGAGAVPDYERLLSHGINVVTTTSTALVFPPAGDSALRDRLARDGHWRRCVVVCVGHLPWICVGPTRTRAHDPVKHHPQCSRWWRYHSTTTTRSPR